jgi:lipoyl(octanoyl) transferase
MSKSLNPASLIVRHLGELDYESALGQMIEFTAARTPSSTDEIWLLEHPAVYTQGTSCTATTLTASSIPVVKTDRGGQITYHGPGQLILYLLADLRRRNSGVKGIVSCLEDVIIELLSLHGILGDRREGAPGVYVRGKKIASLGLRIRRGCCYHGISLNVDMDLSPFENIDPCGIKDLEVTQLADLGIGVSSKELEHQLVKLIVQTFSYTL